MIDLKLTVEEINTILQGLAELPAKKSMLLIQKIHQEAIEQTTQEQPKNDKQNGTL